MTLEQEKVLNDKENPEIEKIDELEADIDEISIADDLTDFVPNKNENNEIIEEPIEFEETVCEEECEETPEELEEVEQEEPVESEETACEEECEETPEELEEVEQEEPVEFEETVCEEECEETPEELEKVEQEEPVEFEETVCEEECEETPEELEEVEQEEPVEFEETACEEECEETPEELEKVEQEEPVEFEETALGEECEETPEELEEVEQEEPVEFEETALGEECEETPEELEEVEQKEPVESEETALGEECEETPEEELVEVEQEESLELEEVLLEEESDESDNVIKVLDSDPIISESYKPYDTFVERLDDNEENQEVIPVLAEPISEEENSVTKDYEEESAETQEEVLEEEYEEITDNDESFEPSSDTNEPLLDEEEMELPERFRKMLEESRMEKRGLTPQKEEKKKNKNKKKAKIENVANELNLEMTDEAVDERLNEFEQYFYEYVIDAEEKNNTYENSYYEAKYDYFIDLAEKGHDLNEYINQGFDAWLAKNYKQYTYRGKARKIKEGFENLKSIPRFNNREILPYVEKRGHLTIEFLNQFNNDIYLNNYDKGIFAKKHSLYPVINYENEMVCYEYLQSLNVEDISQYAEMMYVDIKQETIDFVKSTREYLDPLSIDYEYTFKTAAQNTGYKQSKKISKAGWCVSIWMLILCALIQVLHFIKIPGDIIPSDIIDTYVYAVKEHYLLLTALTAGTIILNVLLLLPTRIRNRKLFKFEKAVDRLVARRSLCRNIEDKLNKDNKSTNYLKMLEKSKKNKIRVNEKSLKEAAISVVDDCAKMRNQSLPSTKLSKSLQFVFIFALAFISSIVYTMLLDGLLVGFMDFEKSNLKFVLVVALGSSIVTSVICGLITKKKSIARWRYHLAVLLAFIATMVINIVL